MLGAVVFDVGGTFIRAGLYLENDVLVNEVIRKHSLNFNKEKNAMNLINDILNNIVESVEYFKQNYKNVSIEYIGLAFPGPVTNNGTVIKAPTLWGKIITNVDLYSLLLERLPEYKLDIINDITAAAYRYINKPTDKFCIITISSGVGCKVVWNGEVLLSDKGYGGEIGHHKFSKTNEMICDCGNSGHIGAIASGRGILKLANILKRTYPELFEKSELSKKVGFQNEDLALAIRSRDEFSLTVLNESIQPIALMISSLFHFIGIDKFILIGGFFNSIKEEYTEVLVDELVSNGLWNCSDDEISQMIISGYDGNNGLIGMGRYIINKIKKSNNR